MPNKKYYFVLSPYGKGDELFTKAKQYYGEKDYELVQKHPDFFKGLNETVRSPGENVTCNTNLLLIGISAMAMSLSDSIYVSKNWEDDDYCKFCHALAFSHGLDIVYES